MLRRLWRRFWGLDDMDGMVAYWCEHYADIITANVPEGERTLRLWHFWRQLENNQELHRRVRRALFQGGE